ncbi:MAG TPA: zinc-binding dehydrogenase [Chthonomonadaceae bacterium]|nr:zinc-binding dehydrogenase [Chthonomonadaceae bacterium]
MQAGYRTIIPRPREVVLEPHEFADPGPGQVLVQSERTLISTGTELTGLTGDFQPDTAWARWIRYPFATGYCNVGHIAQVGEGVERPKVGDRVGSTLEHATHGLAAAEDVWTIPPEVDTDAAAFSILAEIVMGGVRLSRLMFGESVVIIGAGLLGQLATRLCRIGGAWPLIVVDPARKRLEFAREMGATHTLPLLAEEAREEVTRITADRMADIVFEVTGNPVAVPAAMKLARGRGRVVLLGSSRGPSTIDFHEELHGIGLEVIGAHNRVHPSVETPYNPWTVKRHIELFYAWQGAGVLDVRRLITHRYPGHQAPEAFQMLLEDRTQALGVLLDWSQT